MKERNAALPASQAQIHTRPHAHALAFNLCARGKFSVRQAVTMANGFATRGCVDASEGCAHYALRLVARQADTAAQAS